MAMEMPRCGLPAAVPCCFLTPIRSGALGLEEAVGSTMLVGERTKGGAAPKRVRGWE